jgi:hypothetical protein
VQLPYFFSRRLLISEKRGLLGFSQLTAFTLGILIVFFELARFPLGNVASNLVTQHH